MRNLIFRMKLSRVTLWQSVVAILSMFCSNRKFGVAGIDASIDYDVQGRGFHRTIRYHVEVDELFQENCHIALYLSPDPTLYVNIDELANLARYRQTVACSEGEIDAEKFAEKAQSQNITICSPLRNSGTILSLPIHQRYRMPLKNVKYTNITLRQPLLLLGCGERIKGYSVSKVDLCSPCVDLSLKWRKIPYKMKTEDYIWTLAVGDLAHNSYVTTVTLAAVYAGTSVILAALWSSARSCKERRAKRE